MDTINENESTQPVKRGPGRPKKNFHDLPHRNGIDSTKYGGNNRDKTIEAIAELRCGLTKAIKKKYGTQAKWFANLLELSKTNPYMTKVLLEFLYSDRYTNKKDKEDTKQGDMINKLILGELNDEDGNSR